MISIIDQRQSLRHFGTEGSVVLVELGGDNQRLITIARDGVGIHRIGRSYLSWTREEAIKAARSILEYYSEPFCLRIEGSGVERNAQ